MERLGRPAHRVRNGPALELAPDGQLHVFDCGIFSVGHLVFPNDYPKPTCNEACEYWRRVLREGCE